TYCASRGGQYVGSVCRSSADAERILFMAKLERAPGCGSAEGVKATVVEPIDDLNERSYIAAWRAQGHMTAGDLAVRRAMEVSVAAAARADQAQQAADRARQLPLIRKIGAQVCRKEG